MLLCIDQSGNDFSEHGMIATMMRIINVIPHVCATEPGIDTAADLPLTLRRSALRLKSKMDRLAFRPSGQAGRRAGCGRGAGQLRLRGIPSAVCAITLRMVSLAPA